MKKKIDIFIWLKALKKAGAVLAERAFLACLLLFLLALLIGGFLFYKYFILVERAEPEVSSPFLLEEKLYQEVLGFWQAQDEKFLEADFRKYPDPFRKGISASEELTE